MHDDRTTPRVLSFHSDCKWKVAVEDKKINWFWWWTWLKFISIWKENSICFKCHLQIVSIILMLQVISAWKVIETQILRRKIPQELFKVAICILLLIYWVTLGNLLSLGGPQSPHLMRLDDLHRPALYLKYVSTKLFVGEREHTGSWYVTCPRLLANLWQSWH